MDTKPLEDIGLTRAESVVYTTLVKLGATKVGPIIEKSGLQSSVIHNCLHKLLEKGLVNFIRKGKINYYSATNPKNLIDYVEEKKKNIENIVPDLLAQKEMEYGEYGAEIYVGTKGIMNMLLDALDGMERGSERLFFSADVAPRNKEIQRFFSMYAPKVKQRGIKVKGISPRKLKPLYNERTQKGFMQVKYTDKPIPPNISIFKDKIALFMWGEKPIGYLIHSKQLANKYKDFFYTIWNGIK